MSITKVVKYISEKEYIDYAVNCDRYKDRFAKHNNSFADKHSTINEYILALISHYTNKYGAARKMKFALIKYTYEDNVEIFASYGFKDKGYEFYCCC